jgi:hypothetical protein
MPGSKALHQTKSLRWCMRVNSTDPNVIGIESARTTVSTTAHDTLHNCAQTERMSELV